MHASVTFFAFGGVAMTAASASGRCGEFQWEAKRDIPL
jgi:hypothetical protein